LFVLRGFDHDRLAVADAVGQYGPEPVADAGAGISDEDPGGYLDQPSGEVSSQPFWGGDEDDDGHQGTSGSSTSGPVTPTNDSASHLSAVCEAS
jgi:hypothetical protein